MIFVKDNSNVELFVKYIRWTPLNLSIVVFNVGGSTLDNLLGFSSFDRLLYYHIGYCIRDFFGNSYIYLDFDVDSLTVMHQMQLGGSV